jgi:hypothetical protein
MQFVMEMQGFTAVEVVPLRPYPERARVHGSNLAERFNEYFHGPQDYAVPGAQTLRPHGLPSERCTGHEEALASSRAPRALSSHGGLVPSDDRTRLPVGRNFSILQPDHALAETAHFGQRV